MQFTLRSIRGSNGYTMEEVAEYCGIPVNIYTEIEIDPSQAQLSLIYKISKLYRVSMSLIYPGTEAECIKHNKSILLSTG